MLLGAVTSPTDAAAVFSVLRNVPIPHRLRGALEAESGLNDAPTVLLVMLASSRPSVRTAGSAAGLVGLIVLELVGGLAVGVGLGWLGVQGMRRVALPSSGLYPLAAVGLGGPRVRQRGDAAPERFRRGVRLRPGARQRRLPHRIATRSFVEGIGWIAQIGLFVMLGLLASPSRIDSGRVVVALAGGLFLTLVARPLSVLASGGLVPGADPGTGVPVLGGAARCGAHRAGHHPAGPGGGAARSTSSTWSWSSLSCSPCCRRRPWRRSARRLGLSDDAVGPRDRRRGGAPGPDLGRPAPGPHPAEVPTGRGGGRRAPAARDTVVSLIIRDGHPFNPERHERIKVGDELLVVTPAAQRERTEARLRDVGRGGRLARWRTRPDHG